MIQLPELIGQKLIENIGHDGKVAREELGCHTFHTRYQYGSGMVFSKMIVDHNSFCNGKFGDQ